MAGNQIPNFFQNTTPPGNMPGRPTGFQNRNGYSTNTDDTNQQGHPSGYTWDPVKQSYTPTVGSASDQQQQRSRVQGMQDTLFNKFTAQGNPISGLASLNIGGPIPGGMPSPVSAPHQETPSPVTYQQVSGQAEDAARAAIFARSKDQAGQIGNSAMLGLQGALASRGMGGAGYEAGQIGQTLTNSANQLGEESRLQATNELEHAQHVADETYQGGISQRGQDIGIGTNNLNSELGTNSLNANQATAYRGQNISRENSQLQARLSAIGLDYQSQQMIMNALLGLGAGRY